MSIKENLFKIKEQILSSNVKIIAVTKYASVNDINETFSLGIHDFAENYVQNAQEKMSNNLIPEKIKWHFIGRLQKNKIKYVIGNFYLIHSVDSLELAKNINDISAKRNIIQNVLLQVNTSGESSKAGFKSDDLLNNFDEIKNLTNIKINGLMTIAPNTENLLSIKNCFMKLKDLKDHLSNIYPMQELSMGMSGDYKIALECGSTMLRLGRAIFKN